ncbi:MAG: hypothetical protein WD468_07015 [Pirellulales bacterium]
MNAKSIESLSRPSVRLVGECDHPDFAEAIALVRADAELALDAISRACPELIIVAQSRPGSIGSQSVEELRRAAPLAGVVGLLGSWCEGQARASRPTNDMLRLYWYQFATWWRRQLALRAAGHCPEWALPETISGHLQLQGMQNSVLRTPNRVSSGVISLSTPHWETADALADALQLAGLASVWEPPSRTAPVVHGITAGVWDGGQLDDGELKRLAAFCRRLARDSAPVIALLDFPRRDRCELARQAGTATVLGKPWNNAHLVVSLQAMTFHDAAAGAA